MVFRKEVKYWIFAKESSQDCIGTITVFDNEPPRIHITVAVNGAMLEEIGKFVENLTKKTKDDIA